MYLYVIEKRINMETFTRDIQIIQNSLSNSSEIHILIGKIFEVDNIPNWREKYNILYKVINDGSFKLLIKSDKKINKTIINDLNFNILKETIVEVKENEILNFDIIVSPFKKIDKNRIIIKDKKDRLEWLINKLTYNDECEVIDIVEIGEKQYSMCHKDIKKGGTILYGYEYQVKAKIKNKELFENLIKNGIGPSKCYGFGLIDYVSADSKRFI